MRSASRLGLALIGERIAARPLSWRNAGIAGGGVALVGAEACVLFLPPSLPAIVLAAAAAGLLALNRRLGPLGAALLVVVAIPFGRAADLEQFRVGALPLRPQDVAIGVGALLCLPAVLAAALQLRPRRAAIGASRSSSLEAAPTLVTVAFLAVGLLAFGVGVADRHDWTDVVRDARWWLLYGVLLLALWQRARADQLVRGLMVGSIMFATLMVLTSLLPAYAGALKDRATTYDWGQLRLQFSNDPFVMAALAYSAFRLTLQVTLRHAILAGLFAGVIVLSLTRTSMLVALAELGLVVLLATASRVHRRPRWQIVVRAAAVAGPTVVGALAALAVLYFVVPPATATTTDGPTGTQIIGRITFSDPSSDLGAVESGRFEAYRKAAAMIDDSPIVGNGMGSLVYVGTNFGNTRAAKPGYAPGVDDAYLTVALKAGVIGLIAFAAVLFLPVMALMARKRRSRWLWYVPVWMGLMALTVTQSYASSGYGPFPLALLLAVPLLGGSLRRAPWPGTARVPA